MTKVVAAIPAYNMLPQLLELLPQLIKNNFDEIYVLDDVSSDGTAEEITNLFKQVTVIRGIKNLGAAGNRNRILDALKESGNPFDKTYIIFIDADMTLLDNKNIPQTVKELFEKYPDAGIIGGKVFNADGSWGAFNYGPLPLFKWMFTSHFFQLRYERLKTKNPNKAAELWQKHSNLLKDWPNPFKDAEARKVGWLVENFTFINAATFARVGGYDANLRYCETLDLSFKLEQIGLSRIFNPSLSIKHLQVDNRGWHRNIEIIRAVPRLIWKRLVSLVHHPSGV